MLLVFRVENYRSFGPPAELSMVAAPIDAKYPELDVDNVASVQGVRLLKSAAIYGANASGKSNLVKAFDLMRTMVLNSSHKMQQGDEIDVEPFRLRGKSGPSSFEVVFLLDGREYRYGFEADSQNIVEEWLYRQGTAHEETCFERVGQTITLGSDFQKEGQGLAERTRHNALFLSVVAQFNGEVASRVWGWFSDAFVMSSLDDSDARIFTDRMLGSETERAAIVKLVKSLDLGIDDIEIEPLHERSGPFTGSVSGFRILTRHRQFGEKGQHVGTAYFELERHESAGTQKIFAFAGPLLAALRHGHIMIIDEFDARLHPLLTRQLVGLFHDPKTNPRGAQLVFTTHDTNLLDASVFRRDQIWFVEKDRAGSSHLYSLAEYKIQSDDYEQRYIEGRYGAVPHLGLLRRILAETDDE